MTTPHMSEIELACLGVGEVAYVRPLSSKKARAMFPDMRGLPRGVRLFSLHGADGTPIALTDTVGAALVHACEENLWVQLVH